MGRRSSSRGSRPGDWAEGSRLRIRAGGLGRGSGPGVQQASACPVCFDMFSFPVFEKQEDLQVAHQESIKLRGKCDPRRLTAINFYYYK